MDLRAIVTIPFTSGKPEDVTVNVLHFETADQTTATLDAITAAITEFYNVTPPNGPSGNALAPLAMFYSNSCSRVANACSIKFYDLAAPPPRIPTVRPWTLGVNADSTQKELPAEVSLAASFYAGFNQPRRRGRIYLGPFSINATEDDPVNSRARPSVILRDLAWSACKRLAAKPDNPFRWGVYTGGKYTVNKIPQAPVPGDVQPITAGWVDDAWDTQRRRGEDASQRISWTRNV